MLGISIKHFWGLDNDMQQTHYCTSQYTGWHLWLVLMYSCSDVDL